MNMVLEGKVAVVTGGGKGIGRGIVDAFVAAGAKVLACGRGADPGDLPSGSIWAVADVSRQSDVDALSDRAVAEFGRVDVLVNNAGVQIEKSVVDTTDDDWNLLMGANAEGVFRMCRRFIPVMASTGGGSIVNIGSISGNHADPSMAIYNASKAFVHGLTRSIAVDHGAEGIRCNAICPGWIMTAMADAAFELAKDPAKAKADALARHAVGRFGAPADIANAAVWLASDASAYMTGQTMTVDGGLTAATPLQPGLF